MTPRLANRLNLNLIVGGCGGIGEGKEGGKESDAPFMSQTGYSTRGRRFTFAGVTAVAPAENQLKTESRRDLPPDAFVSVSIARATHSD